MTLAAIYVLQRDSSKSLYVGHALEALADITDTLVLVCEEAEKAHIETQFPDISPDAILSFGSAPGSSLSGYKIALEYIREAQPTLTQIILTGSNVFGPVHPYQDTLDDMARAGVDLYSCYWHNLPLDPRLSETKNSPDLVPYLDFAVLGEKILADAAFWDFWKNVRASEDYWVEFQNIQVGFASWCRRAGHTIGYPFSEDAMETVDPRQFEIHRIVEKAGPVIPVSVFGLDPVLHDLNATYLRDALEGLRQKAPALYDEIIAHVVPHTKARDFCMISDQYQVLPGKAENPGKSEWRFGRVAVFIHAYYANMMPQFWKLIQKLPCEVDLFISTATDDDKAHIETFLSDHGWPMAHADVRKVEVNRGRDMSSLFITFRDVIMAGTHEVALRLHSKRTPQVSRQVGESFKDHLFENLVDSPEYVSNLLDMLESEPDIGLVIPPVIHIGFGTLGHSWFNNRVPLSKLAEDLDLNVPFDDFTPVTAYGTMYWFRTDALKKMFEWQWKWDDYNPEPNHIDGGLAHVQERLIGYCVQDKGYRTVSVMTAKNAARNYAKLEYKMQLLAAHLATGNIYMQRQELQALSGTRRMRTYRWLQNLYGATLRRFPASRRVLRPMARPIQALFGAGRMDHRP